MSGGTKLGTKSPPSDGEAPLPTDSPSPHTPAAADSKAGHSEGKPPPLATSTPAKPGGSKTQVESAFCPLIPAAASRCFDPPLQLDSLSRDELVKYVKKQAQLLQKAKSRCAGE